VARFYCQRENRGFTCATAVAGCLLAASLASARYMRPDLVEMPISRLTANVAKQVEQKPEDAALRFNLARLHAMAYATKGDAAKVWRGREAEGPWFGYEPKYVPFTVQPSGDKDKLQQAQEHLDEALKQYAAGLKLASKDAVATLGYGWCLQQAGRVKEAVQALRQAAKLGWEDEKGLDAGRLGGHYITAEAAEYLVPLLDQEKDKEEIARLQERAKRLTQLPRPITPIAVPLRDGLTLRDFVNEEAAVVFDADGSGNRRRWTWITPDAGWLVLDRHGTGQVRSGLQMFGSVSYWLFWDNGYQALAALDDNRDGQIAGDELRGLALWRDANSNGLCEPGEVRPLDQWSITALQYGHQMLGGHPDRIPYAPHGVTFRDGKTRPTYDVLLRPRPQ
jgi:tetratricopeptide (TPR) repeat protein